MWTLGFLALIVLIAWLNPDESGSPTVPGWAEVLVWAQFVVPVIPAVNAGVAKLKEVGRWRPIALGGVFGLAGPVVSIASLIAVFVPFGFNVELKFPGGRVSDVAIFIGLFSVAVALGVVTAIWRAGRLREN